MKKIVLALCLIGILLLTACGAAGSDHATTEEAVEAPAAKDEPASDWAAETDDWYFEDAESEPTAEVDEGTMGTIPILLPSESGRQLVYTADIVIETEAFMPGVRAINEIIAEFAGYSEWYALNGRHIRTPHTERSAEWVFRLPTENLISFIEFAEDNYEIVRLSKRMQDLTIDYEADLDRLADLQEQAQRLQAELDDEENTNDRRSQQDLDRVRAQIRNIEAATARVEHDVIYSDISVYLQEVIIKGEVEVVEEPVTFGDRMSDALEGTFSGLLTVLQGALIGIVVVLPWLVIPAAVTVLIVFLVKRSNKKNKKRIANLTEKEYNEIK
ncbi:MAG: DUF4349 domain-containing protein [Lachnospiraceae bacterium]|nr:DUF4349 domain-containing protein [Lachnospiraceae bacterium]